MLLTLTGAAGSGKTTLERALLKRGSIEVAGKQLRLLPFNSTTNRKPRAEESLSDLDFVSDSEFEQLVQNDAFEWHIEVHGNRYGTRRDHFVETLENDIYIAPITWPSLTTVYTHAELRGKANAVRSIIMYGASEAILRARMKVRGETEATIQKRIDDCKTWEFEARQDPSKYYFIESTLSPELIAERAIQIIRGEISKGLD